MWSAFCVDASVPAAVTIVARSMGEVAYMSGVSDDDAVMARRICVLKRGIDKSLMALTEVEVAINARHHLTPIESGGLEQRRLLLTNLIVKMDARLERLQARYSGSPT